MRYPLWAFFFVFIMPLFTAHALLVGKASVVDAQDGVQELAFLERPSVIHHHF